MSAIITAMPAAQSPPPSPPAEPELYRLSVEQYHKIIDAGVFRPDDRVELIEGVLVKQMVKKSPHSIANGLVGDALRAHLVAGWHEREQQPIALSGSEPEPDLAVARGARRDYHPNHPTPTDLALVIEVSDTTLDYDRTTKKRLYATERIAVYWIVNLVDGVLEVYTDPHGAGLQADYATVRRLSLADQVTITLDGQQVGPVAVRDLLP